MSRVQGHSTCDAGAAARGQVKEGSFSCEWGRESDTGLVDERHSCWRRGLYRPHKSIPHGLHPIKGGTDFVFVLFFFLLGLLATDHIAAWN